MKTRRQARAVRIHQQAQLAAMFVEPDERAHQLMSHFIEELVRGSMSPVDDTILRIDIPLTPVSTKPDPNPQGTIPAWLICPRSIWSTPWQ